MDFRLKPWLSISLLFIFIQLKKTGSAIGQTTADPEIISCQPSG